MSQSVRQVQFEQDLAVLFEVLNAPSPLSPQKVRLVASATVRKWLLDGEINRLAKDLGVRFELPAFNTDPVFEAIANGASVDFYLAGGIQLGGVPVRSIYYSSSKNSGTPPIPVQTEVALYAPGKYLASKRLFFDGAAHTAEQILYFVAVKKGGVHLDFERTESQARLERASAYMTFGNPNHELVARVVDHGAPGGPCTLVIPPERGNLWTALDIELLSATQSLISIQCNGERLLRIGE